MTLIINSSHFLCKTFYYSKLVPQKAVPTYQLSRIPKPFLVNLTVPRWYQIRSGSITKTKKFQSFLRSPMLWAFLSESRFQIPTNWLHYNHFKPTHRLLIFLTPMPFNLVPMTISLLWPWKIPICSTN